MANAADSKSAVRKDLRVRVPSPAPREYRVVAWPGRPRRIPRRDDLRSGRRGRSEDRPSLPSPPARFGLSSLFNHRGGPVEPLSHLGAMVSLVICGVLWPKIRCKVKMSPPAITKKTRKNVAEVVDANPRQAAPLEGQFQKVPGLRVLRVADAALLVREDQRALPRIGQPVRILVGARWPALSAFGVLTKVLGIHHGCRVERGIPVSVRVFTDAILGIPHGSRVLRNKKIRGIITTRIPHGPHVLRSKRIRAEITEKISACVDHERAIRGIPHGPRILRNQIRAGRIRGKIRGEIRGKIRACIPHGPRVLSNKAGKIRGEIGGEIRPRIHGPVPTKM
jgi:hypothetical protein